MGMKDDKRYVFPSLADVRNSACITVHEDESVSESTLHRHRHPINASQMPAAHTHSMSATELSTSTTTDENHKPPIRRRQKRVSWQAASPRPSSPRQAEWDAEDVRPDLLVKGSSSRSSICSINNEHPSSPILPSLRLSGSVTVDQVFQPRRSAARTLTSARASTGSSASCSTEEEEEEANEQGALYIPDEFGSPQGAHLQRRARQSCSDYEAAWKLRSTLRDDTRQLFRATWDEAEQQNSVLSKALKALKSLVLSEDVQTHSDDLVASNTARWSL